MIGTYKVAVGQLNVRQTPSTSLPPIGVLQQNETGDILSCSIQGFANVWAEIGPDRYIATEYNGKKLCNVAYNFARGIDLSEHNVGYITTPADFFNLRRAGISFVFFRASIGSREDYAYSGYKEYAQEAGMLVGSYHFLHDRYTAEVQANAFLDAYIPTTLPPVLDVEQVGISAEMVERWLEIVEAALNRPVMIYTSYVKWKALVGDGAVWASDNPLWVAWHGINWPKLADVFTRWEFWQDQVGRIAGYSPVDMNYANMKEEELFALYGPDSTPHDPKLVDRVELLEETVERHESLLQSLSDDLVERGY